MSGIVGHVMYAELAAREAERRKLPFAPAMRRHHASYLAGSYLGCDIQTLPEAVCEQTGREVGYGTVPVEKSPITGGPVRRWTLKFCCSQYTASDIHRLFYARAHLVFSWGAAEKKLAVPWERLPDYCAAVAGDATELFGPGDRALAYALGWMAHVVGDSLIKSVHPGVDLHLLNGKYTPQNRPIQDLVTFHEVGRKELGLDWKQLLTELPATPVEQVQLHYMRVAHPRGRLMKEFPDGWQPDREPLLRAVLAENRRYLRPLVESWLQEMEAKAPASGLNYEQMVELAAKANFRRALDQIAKAIADLFEEVAKRQRP
jgi:hypothetical protein